MAKLLQCWRPVLSSEERTLIKDYGARVLSPDEHDPFPKQAGHLIRACPVKTDGNTDAPVRAEPEQLASVAAGPTVYVPPVAAERLPVHYTAEEIKKFLNVTKGYRGLQQTVSFFSKLSESEQASSQDVEERFFPLQARIMQQSATLLDDELSLEELYKALQRCVSSAPGQCTERKPPLSCRRAVLTLLPKKGDLMVLKNWCPVALLCIDCKLLSKEFASRLGEGDGAGGAS
ncbi:hypothetical protein AOLI_G00136070 [Acnodon oligacanthus]